MDTESESGFISSAEKAGWIAPLAPEIIKLCGGFDSFLKINHDTGRDVFITVATSILGIAPEGQLPTEPLMVFLKHECVGEISVDRALSFYREHYDNIARSLWISSIEKDYDRYLTILNIVPSLPADFLPVFWRGFGNELLSDNFDSDLSSKSLCRYVVIYTVYMLVYEFQTYIESLDKA